MAEKIASSLAPLAVIPTEQRRGVGSMLVRQGLQEARESGHQIVICLGIGRSTSGLGFRHSWHCH